MRKTLDYLYQGSAVVAAFFLVCLLVMVWLSILGRQFNFHLPGTDAYAGYLMAGSGFLALAHTFKRGEHIRVTLLLGALKGKARQVFEIVAHSVGALLAVVIAFYAARLVWQSYTFHDVSTGNDATPLWIVQLAMAIGCIVFAIALVDEWVMVLKGKTQVNESTEALRNE